MFVSGLGGSKLSLAFFENSLFIVIPQLPGKLMDGMAGKCTKDIPYKVAMGMQVGYIICYDFCIIILKTCKHWSMY